MALYNITNRQSLRRKVAKCQSGISGFLGDLVSAVPCDGANFTANCRRN